MMMGKDTDSMALLLHRNIATKSLAVVSHPVIKTKGGMTLGAGTLFSDDDKGKVISILSDEKPTGGWINESLLYQDHNTIVWYKPAGTYPINFKNESLSAPYPGHVFMYKSGVISAFAFKGRKRPTPETELYYSPTMNVYHDGHICSGNINFPKGAKPDNIIHWENFFFEGINTHFGYHNVLSRKSATESHDAFVTFWKELSESGAASFPSRLLVSMNITVEDIV